MGVIVNKVADYAQARSTNQKTPSAIKPDAATARASLTVVGEAGR